MANLVMANLTCHEWAILGSSLAATMGLTLLFTGDQTSETDSEGTDRVLFAMSFAYWLVYCLAQSAQKVIPSDWALVLTNLRITGAIAYILTFACVMSLPLHRVSTARQTE